MSPVTCQAMLGFLHWLTLKCPELKRLKSLSEGHLLMLVNEYENGKLDGNRTLQYKWLAGFQILFEAGYNEYGYDLAKEELEKLETKRRTKGMYPVTGYTMLNFLEWLASDHPEVEDLRNLPEEDLLQFVNEFEDGYLDYNIDLKRQWSGSFYKLFRNQEGQNGYKLAREVLLRFR